MKEVLYVLAKALVEHPEEVDIREREEADKIVLELRVAPDDMGRVIGKQGKIAKAIRTVVKSASHDSPKKVVVDII
jgi:predicted RNA-binding protein YlqC (UPF0109 family)